MDNHRNNIPEFVGQGIIQEYLRPHEMNKLFCLKNNSESILPSSFIAKADRLHWGLDFGLDNPRKPGMANSDKVKVYRILDVAQLAFDKGYQIVKARDKPKPQKTQESHQYHTSFMTYGELKDLKNQINECEKTLRLTTGDFSDYGIVTKQPQFALLSKETLVQQAKSNLAVCGIYFLIKGDEIVYIGQSVNIFARMNGHANKDYDAITFVPCDKSELDILESLYILAYQPKLNGRTGNRNQGRISSPLSLQQIIDKFSTERE